MKYTGSYALFYPEAIRGEVDDAELESDLLVIRWTDSGGRRLRLMAASTDGTQYWGHFGEPGRNPMRQVQLRLATPREDDGGTRFFEGWWRNEAEETSWSGCKFLLDPMAATP